jgi:anaerobic ribonucleoside-triphosphate reductase activating protein
MVIQKVKDTYPNIPIYVWTGYTLEELVDMRSDARLQKILPLVNTLIEGPYIEEERDTTLSMRGSKNQRILPLDLLNKLCYN